MSGERLQRFEIPYVPFPQNPEKINLLGFEVLKYIEGPQMDKFIQELSDRNPLREYDEVLVNMWGGWELFKDLRKLQNYPKWPYQCEIHRLDGGIGTRTDIPVSHFLRKRKVLLIDDIFDGGKTMREMFKYVGPESRGVVAVWKDGVAGQWSDPRVDAAVRVDNVWLGGKGMDMGFPKEGQIFRQYRGLVVKP